MLSICIPVFDYDIRQLVTGLHKQASNLPLDYEILVYDDGSRNEKLIEQNRSIEKLDRVMYKPLEKNIGRSAIRNLLADHSRFPYILFLDADVAITSPSFLKSYLDQVCPETAILYGGITYQSIKPPRLQLLRWVYGNKREALSVEKRIIEPHLRLLTLNFLIAKKTTNNLKFNEEIPNLRHEDTLYALDAKRSLLPVKHINNPVEHQGLESSQVFLKKSVESSQTLAQLIHRGLIDPKDTKLSSVAASISRYKLSHLLISFAKLLERPILKNLTSKNPSLKIFDFYRLCAFLEEENKIQKDE